MPVRSSSSSVLRWPDRERVQRALKAWADRCARERDDLLGLGVFGSFVTGGWGVGSDLDLVAVVAESTEPFSRRAVTWPLEELPVPADLLVYTRGEFAKLAAEDSRFGRVLLREVLWVVRRDSLGD
jgi:uncharacterized protein